ncbi:MAG: hypothetical protein KF819_09805 [Labilithrix sp.]|nr:hypothetical protein [Labilithrix sp.]
MRGFARSRVAVRIAMCLLAALVMLGAALPWYAKSLAGPTPHVCHCETGRGHASCACPICFPSLDDDDSAVAEGAVSGRCGDDEVGFRLDLDRGLPLRGAIAIAPPESSSRLAFAAHVAAERFEPPDPRPPRA